jgi:SpoIID/LytB domain protein
VVIDPDGKLAAVNVLGAESVLAGVVPSEMFANAPPEALKAQAVAARNHLLSMLGRRHHADPFHLCSEQHCQVYGGLSREDPRTSTAVRDTWGQVLFLGKTLVQAVYSSTCGGHTEDNDAAWGDSADPALRGIPDFETHEHPELALYTGALDDALMKHWVNTVPESYCAKASSLRPQKLRWTRTFETAALQERLSRAYPSVGKLQDVRVLERGNGGRVISLELKGDSGRTTVLRELPIRKLFDNLNSGAFVIDQERDSTGSLLRLTFKGGGWGHGVGMCQQGAIGRAEAGHAYARILGHYFSGATTKQLY